jgi:hypothetical protein
VIAVPGYSLPTTTVHLTQNPHNEIPPMTDPMGRSWRQPADIRLAPMDDTHVMLTRRQVDALPEYSRSYPSGTYNGKCWLRDGEDVQWLCWYKKHADPTKIGIDYREILIID